MVLAASPVSEYDVVLLVPMLVNVPEELFNRYILYDAAPLTAFQLMVMANADCADTLNPAGAARIMSSVVPLAACDCGPSVPFTALILYQYVVLAVSPVSM
jgi:hypothetical protein